MFFFFKQKTAYELRISDWSSDVCSSDLGIDRLVRLAAQRLQRRRHDVVGQAGQHLLGFGHRRVPAGIPPTATAPADCSAAWAAPPCSRSRAPADAGRRSRRRPAPAPPAGRSEEHTSELQSLMRISYAVFCLKKKKKTTTKQKKPVGNNTHTY